MKRMWLLAVLGALVAVLFIGWRAYDRWMPRDYGPADANTTIEIVRRSHGVVADERRLLVVGTTATRRHNADRPVTATVPSAKIIAMIHTLEHARFFDTAAYVAGCDGIDSVWISVKLAEGRHQVEFRTPCDNARARELAALADELSALAR